jgi:hypothetical protein
MGSASNRGKVFHKKRTYPGKVGRDAVKGHASVHTWCVEKVVFLLETQALAQRAVAGESEFSHRGRRRSLTILWRRSKWSSDRSHDSSRHVWRDIVVDVVLWHEGRKG